MSDKFGEGRDPYLYPGLDIMRNRLNIRQQQRLEQAAYEMTALRAATIELGPLVRGLPHLRTIHRQLYQDIFDWAGQLREVDIYQGDTPFCHFAYIEKRAMPDAGSGGREEEGYLLAGKRSSSAGALCEINLCCIPSGWKCGLAQRFFFGNWRCTGYQLRRYQNQANQGQWDLTALQMMLAKCGKRSPGNHQVK